MDVDCPRGTSRQGGSVRARTLVSVIAPQTKTPTRTCAPRYLRRGPNIDSSICRMACAPQSRKLPEYWPPAGRQGVARSAGAGDRFLAARPNWLMPLIRRAGSSGRANKSLTPRISPTCRRRLVARGRRASDRPKSESSARWDGGGGGGGGEGGSRQRRARADASFVLLSLSTTREPDDDSDDFWASCARRGEVGRMDSRGRLGTHQTTLWFQICRSNLMHCTVTPATVSYHQNNDKLYCRRGTSRRFVSLG